MRAEAVTRTEEDVARAALLDSEDARAQDVRPVAAEVAEPQEAPVGGLDAVQAVMVQEAREALRLPAELLHVGHETQCKMCIRDRYMMQGTTKCIFGTTIGSRCMRLTQLPVIL